MRERAVWVQERAGKGRCRGGGPSPAGRAKELYWCENQWEGVQKHEEEQGAGQAGSDLHLEAVISPAVRRRCCEEAGVGVGVGWRGGRADLSACCTAGARASEGQRGPRVRARGGAE